MLPAQTPSSFRLKVRHALCFGLFGSAVFGAQPSPITTNRPLPPGVALTQPKPGPSAPTVLWYQQPPTAWLEALPLGNGSFGAMVFGGVTEEKIQFNHDTIWTHPTFGALGSVDAPLPDVRKAVDAMRAAVFAGDPAKADQLYDQQIKVPGYHFGKYQPMGTLCMELDLDASGGVTGYQHRLDLATGVVTTDYTVAGTHYRREVFALPGQNLILGRITADGPGTIDARLWLEREGGAETKSEGADKVVLWGAAHLEQAETEGTRFVSKVTARLDRGTVATADGRLTIRGAKSAVIVLAGATDFQPKTPFVRRPGDLGAACDALLEKVRLAQAETLQATSAAHHRSIFDRVRISLAGTETANAAMDTRARIQASRQRVDPLLSVQLYDFARYLLMSSSRPGSMPANLQGLWNDLPKPPWNSDYHFNINVQMNYAFAAQANLLDSLPAYLDFLDTLRIHGRKVAREMFGARGFLIGHATAGYATVLPLGNAPYAIWETGAAWGADQIMDYVRFSGDVEYLRRQGFGILEEAALFMLDWMVPHPESGELVVGPGISPEHFYVLPNGRRAATDMGNTMDQQLAWQLFSDYLEAADLIGSPSPVVAEVRAALPKLAPTRLTGDGRVREWSKDYKSLQDGHRHTSMLYAFYPGRQFNLDNAPQMMRAARATLEFRRSHPGGAGNVGWSRMWIGSLYARLREGDQALGMLKGMLADQLFPNLFGKYVEGVYQIDGNFGYAAVVNEMLLQSHSGWVDLLPALPAEWAEGSLRGMLARGGYQVSMEWSGGKLTGGTVRATRAGLLKLRYGDKSVTVPMAAGDQRALLDLLSR